jgi:hypothetical protein
MSYYVAGAIVVSAVYSSQQSKKSAEKIADAQEQAALTQADAAKTELDFMKAQYADIRPYLMRSMEGYQELLDQPEAYKEAPGYQFRLQEGLKAIGIPEGARYLTGTQIKAATRYGQDYATGEYNNALARIAGLGQVAQGAGAIGSQYATNIGNIIQRQGEYRAQGITGAAEARASGAIGSSRAYAQGIEQLYGLYQYNQYNKQQQQQQTQTTAGAGAGM